MARVLKASAAITKAKRPRGYQDFTRQEMEAIMQKPLSIEDYEKADMIMFLLMQTQVRTLLDSQPGEKAKVKTIQGMFTLLDKFTNRSTIGPNSPIKIQVNSGI